MCRKFKEILDFCFQRQKNVTIENPMTNSVDDPQPSNTFEVICTYEQGNDLIPIGERKGDKISLSAFLRTSKQQTRDQNPCSINRIRVVPDVPTQECDLSHNLAKDINSPFSTDCTTEWDPPTAYGLQNSKRVFGNYYLTGKQLKGKLFELDFYTTIVDDIQNFRTLSSFQMSYIKTLSHEDKQELFHLFNNSVTVMSENLSILLV